MIRSFSAAGGATGGTESGSASAAVDSVLDVLPAHRAVLEMRGEAVALVGRQRAQQVRADRVPPALVLRSGRRHPRLTCPPPSAWRIFSSPRRMRPLTVPTGVSSIVAISVCVKPPK